LRTGYERVRAWLAATAPQWKGQMLAVVPRPPEISVALA